MFAAAALAVAADHDLLDAYAQQQNADAFAELVRRHAGMVFGTARRVTHSSEDAEDVAQTCFLELAQKASTIRASVAGYLHTAAMSRATDLVRSRTARRRHEVPSSAAEAAPDRSPPPAEITWDQIEPHVDEALAALSEDLRIPLVLHYMEGQSQSEIGRSLGLNQSTVSRRLENGVEQLRRHLRRAGVTIPAALLAVLLAGHAAEAAPPTLIASLGRMAMAGPGAHAAASEIAPAAPAAFRPHTSRTAIKLIAALLLLGAAVVLLSRYAYLEITRRRPVRATAAYTPPPSSPYHKIARIEEIVPARFEDITFARALEMASSVTPYPAGYRDIVGDSALAFRTRWFAHPRQDMGTAGWLGDGPEEIALLRRSTGWQLNVRVMRESRMGQAAQFAPDVVTSVQSGVPVINKMMSWESGLIYGASSDAQVLLIRDYTVGAHPVLTRELIPLFIFLGNHTEPDARKACVLRALGTATANWTRGRVDSDPLCLLKMPPGLLYCYGRSAFDQWIADLSDISKRSPRSRSMLFQLNVGAINSYAAARRTAREYLIAYAPLFGPEARAALLRAADLYGRECDLLDETRKPYGPDAFLGPWQALTFSDWDQEVRTNEINIIQALRDLDAEAITQLQTALALESAATQPTSAQSAASPRATAPQPVN